MACLIENIIGQYTTLDDMGEYCLGLCPIHFDAYGKPSLVVLKKQQYYYCTSCKANGGVDNFTSRMGISTGIVTNQMKQLMMLFEVLAVIYKGYLFSDEGVEARRYLGQRGVALTNQLSAGMLGYAPKDNGYVYDILSARGFTIEDLLAVKLIRSAGAGRNEIDWCFKDRLMFIIRNEEGHVVGFSGRTIGDVGGIKYMHIGESPVFSKESVLYNLDNAYSKVKETRRAVVMEGFMDVLMAQQAGIGNVVGTMGVMLTRSQVRLLMKACVKEIDLGEQSDMAGQAASERSRDMLKSFAVVKKVLLPVGVKDPADFFTFGGTVEQFNALPRS